MKPTTWRKSSRSASNAQCVEIANTHDRIRDSKNPTGPILQADFATFLTAVKRDRIAR